MVMAFGGEIDAQESGYGDSCGFPMRSERRQESDQQHRPIGWMQQRNGYTHDSALVAVSHNERHDQFYLWQRMRRLMRSGTCNRQVLSPEVLGSQWIHATRSQQAGDQHRPLPPIPFAYPRGRQRISDRRV